MSLDDTIALHRNLYRDDLFIDRLVQRQPPTSLDLNTGVLDQEPAAAIGMTVAGRLLRYVSHPEGYGSDFPWSKALYRLKFDCRKEHPYHRAADRPYWRGSLCWQLVTFVIMRGFSVQNAAEILRYDNPEPVLREALQAIEDSMDHARARAELRQRDDEGRGPGAVPDERPRPCYHDDCKGRPHFEEKPHPDHQWHRAECPQCRHRAA